MEKIPTIYADGSAIGNPGPGGYGTLIVIDGEEIELKGGEEHTTNNRMEMTGVIEGLTWLIKNKPTVKKCRVISDSKLVIETLNSDWKRKKNLDLWKKLDQLLPSFSHISWEWVRGHNGHPENTRVDAIAQGEAARYKKIATKNPKKHSAEAQQRTKPQNTPLTLL